MASVASGSQEFSTGPLEIHGGISVSSGRLWTHQTDFNVLWTPDSTGWATSFRMYEKRQLLENYDTSRVPQKTHTGFIDMIQLDTGSAPY